MKIPTLLEQAKMFPQVEKLLDYINDPIPSKGAYIRIGPFMTKYATAIAGLLRDAVAEHNNISLKKLDIWAYGDNNGDIIIAVTWAAWGMKTKENGSHP